jgi:hypothetical protein
MSHLVRAYANAYKGSLQGSVASFFSISLKSSHFLLQVSRRETEQADPEVGGVHPGGWQARALGLL